MSKAPFPTRRISLCGIFIILMALVSGCGNKTTHEPAGRYPDRNLNNPNAANEGVVLAWRENSVPVEGRINEISVGDTLIVRMRNLDGWLIRMLEQGRLTGEPVMNVKQKNQFLFLTKLRRSLGDDAARFNADVNKGNDSPLTFSEAFLQKPEAGALQTEASTLKVTYRSLLDARIAYNTLLTVVRRGLFLVVNNSQFRQIKAENPDAQNTKQGIVMDEGVTLYELEFRLRRRAGDEEAWNNLYDGTRAVHDVRISAAVELDKSVYVLDTAVFPQAENKVQRTRLELFQPEWLWSVLASLVVFLVFGLWLAVNTPLLRDMDLPLRADGCPQFSLSRLQLAIWTYLAVGAFLIIWLVTDRLDTLNSTILALLGISSGTTLASKLANSFTLEGGAIRAEPERAARRNKSNAELRKELGAELKTLQSEALALQKEKPNDPELASLSVRIQRLREDLDYLGKTFSHDS